MCKKTGAPRRDPQPRTTSWAAGSTDRMYLFEGRPGTGKTTIAMQFLLEGAKRGEPGLYITLSETQRELHLVAKRHGWSLAGLEIFELVPAETALIWTGADRPPPRRGGPRRNTRADLRPGGPAPTARGIDSLSELRLLAQDPLRYRRQVLALKHFFASATARSLLLDDLTRRTPTCSCIRSSHGVILLEQLAIDYGARAPAAQRRQDARHRVPRRLPRLRHPAGRPRDLSPPGRGRASRPFAASSRPSGNAELDMLLGGGLERGTNALLIGAAGVGKSAWR